MPAPKKQDKKEPEETKNSTEKHTVEFIKPWGSYSRGDIAGFEPDKAESLKKMKVAVEPGESAQEPEKEDPPA